MPKKELLRMGASSSMKTGLVSRIRDVGATLLSIALPIALDTPEVIMLLVGGIVVKVFRTWVVLLVAVNERGVQVSVRIIQYYLISTSTSAGRLVY